MKKSMMKRWTMKEATVKTNAKLQMSNQNDIETNSIGIIFVADHQQDWPTELYYRATDDKKIVIGTRRIGSKVKAYFNDNDELVITGVRWDTYKIDNSN